MVSRWCLFVLCWGAGLATLSGCGPHAVTAPEADLKLVDQIRKGSGKTAVAAVVSTGTGWGTLKATFVLDGGPPAADSFSTQGKDVQICGTSIKSDSLVVDSGTRGIANIVVYARKVSRIKPPETPPEKQEPVVFDQKHCMFLSHVMAVEVGRPVNVLNSDPAAHNTNLAPQGNPIFNPLLGPGGKALYTFKSAISMPAAATCSIHPWMKAYLLARKDPYFAVSSPQGQVEIANLPAGEEIEFQAWHERAGGKGGGLEAKSGWNGGRFKVTVPADGVQDLGTIAVPTSAF